jgi:hypothetical protein
MGGDEVNGPKVAVSGLIGALIVFLLIIGAQALYYHVERGMMEEKLGQGAPPQLRELEAQQEDQLHSYRWAEATVPAKEGAPVPAKKAVAIPIERAMELIEKECEKRGGI